MHSPSANTAACSQVVYDGHDAEAVKLLQQVVHVTLIHLHDPFASTLERQEYDLYAQRARAKAVAASAPGNFQLMEKQGEAAGEGRPRTEGAGSGSWEAAGEAAVEGGSTGREAGQLGDAAGEGGQHREARGVN